MSGSIAADRLKRDVERIKKHRQERKDIGVSEREIFKALKGDGYNPTALRKLLAFEDMKDRQQVEDDMDSYRVALGWAVEQVRSGEMSARDAAKAAGIGKTSVYKELAVREMSADDLGKPDGGDDGGREMTADDLGKYEPKLKPGDRFAKLMASKAEDCAQTEPLEVPKVPEIDVTLPKFLDRRVSA